MKKFYIILGLLIILAFGLGYYISNTIKKCPINAEIKNIAKDTYAAGWAAAKKRLQETGNYIVDTNFPIKEIWGTVKEVGANKMTISIKPIEPLADSSLDDRIIVIDNKSILSQQVKKSDPDYNQEILDYNKKYKDDLNGPVLPAPYPNKLTEKTVSFGDFKIGQKVKIETENDVRNIKEFKAAKIIIQYSDIL